MVLYLSIMFLSTVFGCVINAFVFAPIYDFSAWYGVYTMILAVVAVFSIDIVVALIVRIFPQRFYAPERFKTRKWERSFYLKIGIKKWKDKIPEIGKLIKVFDKTEIKDKKDPQYLYKFLCELGYAEVMHKTSIFAGYIAIFFFPMKYWFMFGLLAAVTNSFLQILPTMVQRYNRPKLMIAYQRALKEQNRK